MSVYRDELRAAKERAEVLEKKNQELTKKLFQVEKKELTLARKRIHRLVQSRDQVAAKIIRLRNKHPELQRELDQILQGSCYRRPGLRKLSYALLLGTILGSMMYFSLFLCAFFLPEYF